LTRFVLASTQELHEKIAELATRVRQLEDGLRSSHDQLSSEPHPLLSEELLRIKAPLQREAAPLRNTLQITVKEEEQNPDVVDAFGSLSITLSGRAKYFGQTANSWVSFMTFFFYARLESDTQSPSTFFRSVALLTASTTNRDLERRRMSPLRKKSRRTTLRTYEPSSLQKYYPERQPCQFHLTIIFLTQPTSVYIPFTGTYLQQIRHTSCDHYITAMRRGCKSASSTNDPV
jgi:hypothetical protein